MNNHFRHALSLFVVMGMFWTAFTISGFADIRVVERSGGVVSETYYRGNLIATPLDDGGGTILRCDTGDVTIFSSKAIGRYWEGHINVFIETVEGLASMMPDSGGMGDFLGGLFGGGQQQPEEILVRVNKVGEETVAGYAAERYVIETGSSNNWRLFEEISISEQLLNEITGEVGDCFDSMMELVDGMSGFSMFGMDELEAVLNSDDYKNLVRKGFPVRSKQIVRGFAGETESSSVLVEVSHESVSDDHFKVPDGYQKVGSVFEVMGM